jgi:hypothetical protein
MNNTTNKMAVIGMTNVTTMAISKGIAFVGGILMVAGMGGMMLSNKCFTEVEMKYLAEHVAAK